MPPSQKSRQKRASYFTTTSYENWTRDGAIKWYRREFPDKAYRAIMGFISSDLLSVIGKSRDLGEVDAAQTLLDEFRSTKSEKRARTVGNNSNVGSIYTHIYNDQRGSNNIILQNSAAVPSNVSNNNNSSFNDASTARSDNNNYNFESSPSTTSTPNTDHKEDDMNDLFRDPTSSSSSSPPWSPLIYREKLFQASVLALKKGSLSLSEISKIRKFASTYKPSSTAAMLDNYNSRLISTDLSKLSNVMALKYELFGWKKTTASHIIDTCSKESWRLLKREFRETDLLKKIIDHHVLLPHGLPSECRAMFENIIKNGRDENGVLQKGLLDIGIAKKKLELRQSSEQIDDESLQVLDVISAIIMNLPEKESKGKVPTPGENTFYRRVAQLLDVIVRDTSLQLV
ncbi:hypothetical protein INT45_000393, partial [Circinella minor]